MFELMIDYLDQFSIAFILLVLYLSRSSLNVYPWSLSPLHIQEEASTINGFQIYTISDAFYISSVLRVTVLRTYN
jgi:hypothetical protein